MPARSTSPLALLAVLIGASISGGCGPAVAWRGRSPDGARRAVVVEGDGGRQRLVLDGAPAEAWDAIGVSHLAWTPSGPVYPARRAGRWHLVVGADAGPGFDAIGDVVTAGERVAYAALHDDGWRVVIDGEPGPVFRALVAESLAFGPGGRRLLYVARDAHGERVVIDDAVGPPFDRVARVGFGAKGTLVGYAGLTAEGAHVVLEDRVGPRVDAVLELALAEAEPRWAAIVRTREAMAILHDGARVRAADEARALRLSEDGAHLAWLEDAGLEAVGREGDVSTGVWLDGQPAATHAAVEGMRFVPGTGALLYVAHDDDGVRVVHAGVAGPRLDAVHALVTGGDGRWGYVGARGVGRAVVIDGALRFRGEWAGALALAARGDRWAFLARQAGRRFVVTPDGRVPVPSPFADTLVLDREGQRWGLAVADRATRTLRVLVDGHSVARLDLEELGDAIVSGRDPAEVARAIVRAQLDACAATSPECPRRP